MAYPVLGRLAIDPCKQDCVKDVLQSRVSATELMRPIGQFSGLGIGGTSQISISSAEHLSAIFIRIPDLSADGTQVKSVKSWLHMASMSFHVCLVTCNLEC